MYKWVCVCVCSSSCCLCNSSKHQGGALLCWINKSLTSIATLRLWNTHRQLRFRTLNSRSFSTSPTLLFHVSNYTPVKYLLISTLVVFSPFDLFLILHFWIHFHNSGWRYDRCGALQEKRTFLLLVSYKLHKLYLLNLTYFTIPIGLYSLLLTINPWFLLFFHLMACTVRFKFTPFPILPDVSSVKSPQFINCRTTKMY